jgi:maltose O-acetyltransferase
MLAGEPYLAPDAELNAMLDACSRHLRAFNDTPRTDGAARMAALERLVGKPTPKAWIETPFACEYGVHLDLGDCFINVNCTFLDSNRITIGDQVAIGPNVQLITAAHPLEGAKRLFPWPQDPQTPFRVSVQALPITIEKDVWIGAGVIVLPGVTIGRGTTVGAGSVVTRSLPPYVVAVGSPARVVRHLDPTPSAFHTPEGKA